jgi:hypothetical protein
VHPAPGPTLAPTASPFFRDGAAADIDDGPTLGSFPTGDQPLHTDPRLGFTNLPTEEADQPTEEVTAPVDITMEIGPTTEAIAEPSLGLEFGSGFDSTPSGTDYDAVDEWASDKRQGKMGLVLAGAAVMSLAAVTLLGVLAWQLSAPTDAPPPMAPGTAPADEVATADDPAAADAAADDGTADDPAADDAATDDATAAADPKPAAAAPKPKPKPKAKKAPGGTSARALTKKGWNSVSGDPKAAAEHFKAALAKSPGNDDASYGLGYALLQLEDVVGATPHLCAAAGSSSVDIQREVGSMISRNGITCP